MCVFFFQAVDGIRDLVRSRGLGDVYKRQMQIISNCAFFMLPVLPGLWGGDPTYINGFVSVNMLSAIAIVVIFGWREMGRTTRAKWSDLNAEVDPEQDSEKEYMLSLIHISEPTRPY